MPREPRSFEAGVVYHLIARIVERKFLIATSLQRDFYLELQRKALKRSDWRLLSYAIMSNHIHLAVIAGFKSLDSWLRPVHAPFADLLNKEHDRIGPVFVRGPKAFAVPHDRTSYLIAYIHNNPVRAGVCATAIESSWTSHRAYVGESPRWLDVSSGVALSGVDRGNFDSWVNDPERVADTSFSEKAHELELLRAEEEQQLLPGPPDHIASAIVESASAIVGIAADRVRSKARGREEVTARAVAVHSATLLGLPARRIATALSITPQRVSILRRQTTPDETAAIAQRVCDVVRDLGTQVEEVVPRP